jgi:hypothetical protein
VGVTDDAPVEVGVDVEVPVALGVEDDEPVAVGVLLDVRVGCLVILGIFCDGTSARTANTCTEAKHRASNITSVVRILGLIIGAYCSRCLQDSCPVIRKDSDRVRSRFTISLPGIRVKH